MTRLSVIITTHNRPKQVKEALSSVLCQTRLPDEIILVDDGSDDVLEPAIPVFVPFRMTRFSRPQGGCAARNKGAEMASGDVLMFLDDDDTWEPDKIEAQMAIFEQDEGTGLVYTGRMRVYDDDRERVISRVWPEKEGRLFPSIFFGNVIGPTSSAAVRRHVFLIAGGFDERFPAMQDFDLWIRCCRITRVRHDGGCRLRYTVSRANRQVSGKSDNHRKALKILLEKYKASLSELSRQDYKRMLASRYRAVAVAVRKTSYLRALWWALKANLLRVHKKDVTFLVPFFIVARVKRYGGRRGVQSTI
ncbi:glycosyltransferase [Alteribacter lacisalsi]|uniref:Glycosyltransferase n=1 Tax=Alteribacter lacisalsi TaxID=2045244 RepID=A0A2W0HQQ0_9BACI|nr:glycosyltransferase family 2 protein [Alteribacter lacisalsi]PYZ95908.1 glycosyltransferase [Alteribacter lacisalsi]